ncbi:MAG: hypothetical protein COB29_13280 [Sulfitobacter sp.]|nr:MAG: hypothetical protein COB29_13280 [Sulfitobacter sp.]
MSGQILTNDITAYKPFQVQLSDLEKENKKLVFDYEDKKGNKDARSHIYKLRQSRSAVEKVRVAEKKESFEHGKKVDAEAKVITDKFGVMIEVHAKPIREIEEREETRKADIAARIERMSSLASGISNLSSSEIGERLSELKAIDLNESFGEFLAEAGTTKDSALTALEDAHTAALKGEAEQAELIKFRKEAEEREQKDREEKIRLDAAANAKADAERKAADEKAEIERKAQAEKDAAEKRELTLKLEKEDAERRAAEAVEQAKREQQEEADRLEAESKKREANKRHRTSVMKKAMKALVTGGIPKDHAREALNLILSGTVPNVSISF